MDNSLEKKTERLKAERVILIAYSFYCFGLSWVALRAGWESWIVVYIDSGLIASWGVYLTGYKSARWRAHFTALMMQFSVVLYALHADSLYSVLATFCRLSY